MIRARVIPCLLLRDGGLVKTRRFRDPVYLGDPINAVKIFNDKEVDELIFLDIRATVEEREPPFDLLAEIASQCFMPLTYGGGVRTLDQIERIISLGVEKVAINARAAEDPSFIRAAAQAFGSSTIVVSVDVKRSLFGKYRVCTHGGRRATGLEPVRFARSMEEMGAGELLLTSIDRDGTMIGYDTRLIEGVVDAIGIPVVVCGGAGRLEHFAEALTGAGASAVAAGSLFVFHGKHRAVLINVPAPDVLEAALQ